MDPVAKLCRLLPVHAFVNGSLEDGMSRTGCGSDLPLKGRSATRPQPVLAPPLAQHGLSQKEQALELNADDARAPGRLEGCGNRHMAARGHQVSHQFHGRVQMGFAQAGEFVNAQGLALPEEARVVRVGRTGAPGSPMARSRRPRSSSRASGSSIATARARLRARRALGGPGKGGVPPNMPIEVREVMSAPPADL
jgi:hypothetical protein